ncbi:hypothetical protein HK102_009515 [Quaeritorhiza haematococci]|nr:hypothetical protein HK102_009515 [Quaeritorhiza haematococci]
MQEHLQQTTSRQTFADSLKKLAQTYARARDFVTTSLCTHLPFTHWPAQIALSCLLAASKDIGFTSEVEEYLRARFEPIAERVVEIESLTKQGQEQEATTEGEGAKSSGDSTAAAGDGSTKPVESESGEDKFRKLMNRLEEAATVIKEAHGRAADKKAAQEINEKLNTCKNPEFNPQSFISKRRLEEEKKDKERKRLKKVKREEEKLAELEKVMK